MAKDARRPLGPAANSKGKPARRGIPAKAAGEGSLAHVAAVLARARETGLTSGKGGRIAGRVSPELIERAKARTGLNSDTELVEFALANIALDDDFLRAFRDVRGTVDPDLDLGA